jgi:hypothetical protein
MTPLMSNPARTRVLAVIPSMAQLNTPFPSTAYLTGFLRSRGVHAQQVDPVLALVPALFTPGGPLAERECIAGLPPQRRTPRPGRIRRDAQARHLISGFRLDSGIRIRDPG